MGSENPLHFPDNHPILYGVFPSVAVHQINILHFSLRLPTVPSSTMVVKLYGSPFSTYTRLALVVAKELGIEYEFINIDLAKQENLKPEYKAYQPFGQVPCIVSEIVIIFSPSSLNCQPCRTMTALSFTNLEPSHDTSSLKSNHICYLQISRQPLPSSKLPPSKIMPLTNLQGEFGWRDS